MVEYPIGELVDERIKSMGVLPIYRRFQHDGVRGPNIATVYSDRGYGVALPSSSTIAPTRQPPVWPRGLRLGWHLRQGSSLVPLGGIFAALSPATADLIVEAMQAARDAGAIVSFDLNYRGKIWAPEGGQARAGPS